MVFLIRIYIHINNNMYLYVYDPTQEAGNSKALLLLHMETAQDLHLAVEMSI